MGEQGSGTEQEMWFVCFFFLFLFYFGDINNWRRCVELHSFFPCNSQWSVFCCQAAFPLYFDRFWLSWLLLYCKSVWNTKQCFSLLVWIWRLLGIIKLILIGAPDITLRPSVSLALLIDQGKYFMPHCKKCVPHEYRLSLCI